MKKLLSLMLLAALAGFVSGCASTAFVKAYPGAERPAVQLASVIVPASVEVRSVNGEKLPNVTGMLRAREYTVATVPGAQNWSVRYYQPLADGYYADPQAVTESPWTPLKFEAAAGQAYRLQVETPRENPKLRYEKERVRFSVGVEKAASIQAAAIRQPQSLPPVPVAGDSAKPAAVPKTEAPQTLESAALQQLQNWWRAAGAQERSAFLNWIKTQP